MNIIMGLLQKIFGKFTPLVVGALIVCGIGYGYYNSMGYKMVQGEVTAANSYCTIVKEVDPNSFWGMVKNVLPRRLRQRHGYVTSPKMDCAQAAQTLASDPKWAGGNVAQNADISFKYVSPFNGQTLTGTYAYEHEAKVGDKITIRASGMFPSSSYPI